MLVRVRGDASNALPEVAGRCGSPHEPERGRVDIIISNASGKPIYEQITAQIKELILTGDLKPGEQLPSIRALANALAISAITTKRAYADLETAGFIESVPGKGSFVTGGNLELLREERLRKIEGLLQEAVDEARYVGLEASELHEMLAFALTTEKER